MRGWVYFSIVLIVLAILVGGGSSIAIWLMKTEGASYPSEIAFYEELQKVAFGMVLVSIALSTIVVAVHVSGMREEMEEEV